MASTDGLRVVLTPIAGKTKGKTREYLTPEFRMQCAPLDSFAVTHGHNHVRGTNYQGAETLRRTQRRLVSLPLRTLVVEYASWVVEDRWDLEDMLQAFKAVSQEGWPFRLMAYHPYNARPEIDRPMVLEQVVLTEQANEPDARYLDLQFTEKDDSDVGRATNRRSGAARVWPYTIELRKNGSFAVAGHPSGWFQQPRSTPLTLESIARYAYGAPSLARWLGDAQSPKLHDWGVATPLVQHARFKKGGKIVVPEPPAIRTDRGGSVKRQPPVKPIRILG